jgi:eukaryotic-like serine/threonine-protein kinase
VIHLLEQVCSALAEAHQLELIHRDIKPANIMVCQLGERRDVVKVFDFGLAKDLTTESGLTGSLVAGTPAFLAPDMIADPTAVTPATDLYAVGATAYFLLTGSLVFDGKTIAEVCMHHVQTPPEPVGNRAPHPVPPELAGLVMQCLAKKAGERPASARTMAQVLRALAAQHPWTEEASTQWWAVTGNLTAEREPSDAFSPVTMTVDFADRQSTDQGPT